MKKIISLAVIIILSCSFPLFSSAQTELNNTLKTKNQPLFKNQFDLDVHFLAIEATYKRRLSKKLFMGAGVKYGSTLGYLYYDNQLISSLDMIFGRVLLDYTFSKRFHMSIGAVYGLADIRSEWDYEIFKGVEMRLFYKMKKWEIGLQFKLGNTNKTEELLYALPSVVIKIPIERW